MLNRKILRLPSLLIRGTINPKLFAFNTKILNIFAGNRILSTMSIIKSHKPFILYDKQPKKDHQQNDQKDNSKQNDNNQNQNNNKQPKEPKEPKDWKDWKEKMQLFVKNINQFSSYIYNKKFSIAHVALVVLASSLIYLLLMDRQNQQITPEYFMTLVQTGIIKQITFVEEELFYSKNICKKKIQGKVNNQKFYCYVTSFDIIMQKAAQMPEVQFSNQKISDYQKWLQDGFIYFDVISMIVIIAHLISIERKGGGNMGGMGGLPIKKKKFEVTQNVNARFDDVAGLHEVKREVQQIVDFLKFPSKYTSLGAKIPKGVLLTGPPGTGKTLLAKACAGEAGVPFYTVSGSDFVQMYVGVGAARVRQLFKMAKSQDKAAIIFIDELDAIGKKRMNKLGGNDERQGTLNQLLVEMDGFQTGNKVVVMGATNRKQILDSALVRPGRFDREVEVNLPDLKGRFEIFKVHLKPLKLSSKYSMDEYAKRLASLTPGFSGAEIANLCNEAAILSARHSKQMVQMIDFQISSERVIGGVERKGFVSLTQKKTVAYHQCGHAVVSWFLQGADPLLKVTIIPRSKGALGFAQYFINQNQLQTKQQILDRICFTLGGRCSELYFFNQVTTGAYDDLSKAYDLAYNLIAKYGMGEDLAYIGFPQSQYTKPYGEKVEATIDMQLQRIIKACTHKTQQMVKKHEQDIKNLAEQLYIKETLDVRAIQKILGKRPFPPNKTFQAYLQTSDKEPVSS